MPRRIRLTAFAVVAGALVSTAVLWFGAVPAGASWYSGLCIPLLPQTCATTVPPTTKPPPTTAAPTTTPAHPTTTAPKSTAPKATVAPTTPTTAARRTTPGAATVGSGGLPAAAASGDLSALGTGVDPAAPQLAATTVPNIAGPRPPVALPGLVGASKGLPDDHATARLALSILVLMVALVALGQFPASRRSPRPSRDRLD